LKFGFLIRFPCNPVIVLTGSFKSWSIFLFLSTSTDPLKTLHLLHQDFSSSAISRHHLIVSEFRRKNFDKMSDEMSEEMSDKMSDVGPCRSFKCIVELDESAVNEAFAPEAMCLFMKTFESSDLDPELFICFNVCKGPNSVRNLSISITNRSKSEFEIVSFNGSRINGGNLSLKPSKENSNWIIMF
jgi:hypothetical protein